MYSLTFSYVFLQKEVDKMKVKNHYKKITNLSLPSRELSLGLVIFSLDKK